MVLSLNILYGVSLVILHALLLAESDPVTDGELSGTSRESEPLQQPERLLGALGVGFARSLVSIRGYDSWMLELQDLELAWGHELLGTADSTCLSAGLLYGIVVILMSIGMLYMVSTGHALTSKYAHWFVAIFHIEIILYVLVFIAKAPKLCKAQVVYWPKLAMDCDVLLFTYFERSMVLIAIGSLCTWIFSSFAFFLQQGSGGVAASVGSAGLFNHRPAYNVVSAPAPAQTQALGGGYSYHPAINAGGQGSAHYFPRQGSSLVSSNSGRPYYH